MAQNFGGEHSAPAPTNVVTAGAGAQRRSGLAWLGQDVVLPFALGLLCGGGFYEAFRVMSNQFLNPNAVTGLTIRAEQAVLLAPPLLILIIGIARAQAFWRASGRGLGSAPIRLTVVTLLILAGLAPIYSAVDPVSLYSGSSSLSLLASFVATGFSLGLALGFVWGAHRKLTWGGTVVGLVGGLGLSTPTIALALNQLNTAQLNGYASSYGFSVSLMTSLLVYPLYYVVLTIVGAAFGALLSGVAHE